MKPKRYKRWKFLYWLVHGFFTHLFHLEAERLNPIGPCLIIANHVTNWDPLLLAISFPNTPIRFVASEHIFRHGILSKLLNALIEKTNDTMVRTANRIKLPSALPKSLLIPATIENRAGIN